MSINTDYQQYWSLGQSSFWNDEELKKVASAPISDTLGLEALQINEVEEGKICQRKDNTAQ